MQTIIADLNNIVQGSFPTVQLRYVIAPLNALLKLIHDVLDSYPWMQSELTYSVKPRAVGEEYRHKRTGKIFRVNTHDSREQQQLYDRFLTSPITFWDLSGSAAAGKHEEQPSALLIHPFYCGLVTCLKAAHKVESTNAHQMLHYRLSCISVYILKEADPWSYTTDTVVADLATIGIRDNAKRLAARIEAVLQRGKKLFYVAQRLGWGSIWWISREICHSAYVRRTIYFHCRSSYR